MELRADNYSNDGFELLFALFEPKTGKQIASGFGYPTMQSGRNPLPPIGASRVARWQNFRARRAGKAASRRPAPAIENGERSRGRILLQFTPLLFPFLTSSLFSLLPLRAVCQAVS